MAFGGAFLRLLSTIFYFLEFCCASIGLAIYSYFLAKLSYHDRHIKNDWKAVEGLTGSAVLYTIFAVLLTCFLGGARFFAILAIIFDVVFCGAFIAVAILTKDGADSCNATMVTTPLGKGLPMRDGPAGTNLGLACRINKAVFATAVIAAILFLVSVVLQFFVMRHHQNEKKYGPSPANNYTSGKGDLKFWQRKPKTVTRDAYGANNAELGTVGATGGLVSTNGPDTRTSYDTGYTGTTATQNTPSNTYNSYKVDTSHSGYQTGPVGTTVNPYGYNNTQTTQYNPQYPQYPTHGTATNY